MEHELINSEAIESRLYQQTIFNSAAKKNTLVVLPTGLGKTNLAVMLAADRLAKIPESKVLLMAPTRPLVLQHCKTFEKTMNLPPSAFNALTGHVPPSQRNEVWENGKVIFATPQVVERDIVTGKLSLDNFSLIIFDEAHRAVGSYPYSFIAEQYARSAKDPLILGLTASPGGAVEKIEEVKNNLFIENIETRVDRDSDVAPYVQPVKIEWRRLELPKEFAEIKKILDRKLTTQLRILKKYGLVKSARWTSKRELLEVQREVRRVMLEHRPSPPTWCFSAIIAQSAAFKLSHAIELLETQGLDSLSRYMSGIMSKAGNSGAPKSVKMLARDSQIRRVAELSEELKDKLENPKIVEAKKILEELFRKAPHSKAIVFAHYRDSAGRLVEELNKVEGVRAVKFVGQTSRDGEKGLSQKEQGDILDRFKVGLDNVLVSTSVGEEGLDIPSVDLVLFYEGVPSGIRLIQRRGRTGRHAPGRMIALLAKGTRDEAFYWSAVRKEKQMHEAIRDTGSTGVKVPDKSQKALEEFKGEKIKIIADHREVPSGVVRELTRMGAEVETKQLEVGDFLLSERVGIERKTVEDFLQSMIDKRLMTQVRQLTENFDRPVLILEGDNLYDKRAIHPNAIKGSLASLAVDYHIPILPSKDEIETASLLYAIARREQQGVSKEIPIRGEAMGLNLPEQQRFVIEGLPGVSAVLAKRLLEHFTTVENVMKASEEELMQVHGIGKEKAANIRRVLIARYRKEKKE